MVARIVYSEAEKEEIIRLYSSGIGCKRLQAMVRGSDSVIRNNLREWGIEIRGEAVNYSEEQKNDIIYRYSVLYQTTREIATVYDTEHSLILNRLEKWGIERRQPAYEQRYIPSDNAFTGFDPLSMFWSGMITTDGNIARNPNEIPIISLTSTDFDIIEKLAWYLELAHKKVSVREAFDNSKEAYTFQFRSKRIADFLENNCGAVPNKSLIMRVPNRRVIADKYFWLGAICGNGRVGYTTHGYPIIYLSSGSRKFTEQYVEFLDMYGLHSTNQIDEGVRTDWRYTVSGSNAIPIVDFLFRDAPICLDRKYDMAMKILSDERYL